jgi:hypothetical protein
VQLFFSVEIVDKVTFDGRKLGSNDRVEIGGERGENGADEWHTDIVTMLAVLIDLQHLKVSSIGSKSGFGDADRATKNRAGTVVVGGRWSLLLRRIALSLQRVLAQPIYSYYSKQDSDIYRSGRRKGS